MNARYARLLLAAALLAGTPLAAQPALTGPEIFLGPTNQMATLKGSATATDATGRLLVVWVESLEGQGRLRGRAFDAAGKPAPSAFTFDTGDLSVVGATLAPDAPDGFLLTWQTSERVGQADVLRSLALRLSPSGQPRGDVIEIRSPFIVAQGFPTIGSMQTASAPDGSFVAVWRETSRRTRRDDVFFRLFDAAGRPLAKAALLPNEGGNKERSPAALTVLDDGEIRIAWRSRTLDGASSALWLRRFDRNGAPLAARFRLPPDSANAWDSAAGFGPDGGWLVVWGNRARAYTPGGTPFSEQQFTTSFRGSHITAERGGTFLVSDGTSGLQLEADGTPRGPAGRLTRPSRGGDPSSITGTVNGGFVLFWIQDEGLFGQFLATASPGTLQIERARSALPESASEPLELRILRRDGVAGTVSVDYRLTGTGAGADSVSGIVTFPDGDSRPQVISIPVSDDHVPGNDRNVHVELLRPTGGAVLGAPRRAVVEIRDDDEPSPLLAHAEPLLVVAHDNERHTSLWGPDLAVSPGGDFEVAWKRVYSDYYHDRDDFSVQGQRFDVAAHPAAGFGNRCSGNVERIRLAMHPEGDFMLFWESWLTPWHPSRPEGPHGGFLKRFDALGAAAGPDVSLGYLPEDAAPLPKGRFVAVGRGQDRTGEGLFTHFLSAQGIDRRSPVLVTRQALQPGSVAAVAADGIGRSVVVWSAAATDEGPAGIFARRFNASGAPLGPPFRVSRWESHDVAPGVAMDVHGNFAVAWQRSWDGSGTGIYARAFNAAGAPLTDEIPVNSDTQWNQEAPSIALTGDGRFAVLWQSLYVEDYADSTRVVGQLFAADGTRLGSEAEIDPDGEDPVIAWSDQGFFVIAYGANSDILARRLPL